MGPIKRKTGPTNDSFVRSKKIGENDNRPQKRLRQEETVTSDTTKPNATVPTTVHAPKIARAKEEEAAFPRGGASVLTPLEHKQINIDATRDVLFEHETASRAKADGGSEATASHGGKKRKSKSKGTKDENSKADEDNIRIEGLSYKRLVPGSLVLGQVSKINVHDIALALPNNLTGYVPLTSISGKLTERVEKLVADDGASDDDTSIIADDIDLNDLFSIGQYLRAFVVSTNESNASGAGDVGKRRIELSLLPQQANNGITAKELAPNSMIMASVVSVEDHGIIMDIGLQKSSIGGFMSSKEIGYAVEMDAIQEGAVMLCMITGLSSNGKIVKLSADIQKIANSKKPTYLSDAPTVDAFLPGTAVEFLLTDITPRGVAGKVMGSIDVTADLIHSGLGNAGKDLEKKYKVGSKVKARIICTFPNVEPRKLGISLLDHVMSLSTQQAQKNAQKHDPLQLLPLSSIIEEATVKKVQPGIGLFVDIGIKGVQGFVHISRVADAKVETLSESVGPYKVDSTHRGRVVGYNSLDGIYLVSLEQRILEQPFLQIEDLTIGEVVKGKVDKLLINEAGIGGLLVKLADGITGLVPEMHMADVKFLHPEKKFKEGLSVTARVLSTDLNKRQFRLTLKKALVNSESPVFKSYEDIEPGSQSPGTIITILSNGAVVQFYGSIRGFLPVSEMSESFIQDPSQHFRIGQVVNVHVLNVDPAAARLTVSCKDPSAFGLSQQSALKKLRVGEIVSATVTEKSNDDISVELEHSGLRAILRVGHLTDGSEAKNLSAFKKIRVGQTLQNLAVIDKVEKNRLITLTNKPTLVKAANERTLLREFADVKENKIVHGFVKNITPTAVFVQFGGGVTGLLPKSKLQEEALTLPDFGLRRLQSLTTKVVSVDQSEKRFLLSVKDINSSVPSVDSELVHRGESQKAINPVDESITAAEDLTLGRVTMAKIASVKETQINVQLADNIQGRIDVSEVFGSWEEIKDRKHPLKQFSSKQTIPVRVLGIHDAKNHRFLPITHTAGKTAVFELSAKVSKTTVSTPEALTLNKVKVGSSWIAFVNNVRHDCLWVNISPNVRGRIGALDISDDVSLLNNLESKFPVGSAIKVNVTGIDVANNRLDLSARSAKDSSSALNFQDLKKDMVVPARVTKVTERQIMVQLSDKVSGPVNLTDLTDDFSDANPTIYSKNDIVRVCITDVDVPNKRIRLTTRPSRVLNSSLPVNDPEVSSVAQLKVNDVVRGFVKNVAENGIFISLGGNVTAYTRVSDLSDAYIKEWKSSFQVDQLVKGKVIAADPALNHVQLSLKSSVVDNDYVAPISLNDLEVGQTITGKIRKVEDFGVFIVVDGSMNVSGLCHKSEMAENRVTDVKKLYSEGDAVKAKVLKIELDKRRISFGLKASYFKDQEDSDDEMDDGIEDGMEGVQLGSDDEADSEEDDSAGLEKFDAAAALSRGDDSDSDMEDAPQQPSALPLEAGGFSWTASTLDDADQQAGVDSDDDGLASASKKKSRRKPLIKIDRTGELDANGPQSTSDFERLLLSEPDSSQLWIEYMAFQVKLSELAKAREVAERAIRTINMREEAEKMNVWIALLNLENAYGSDDTTEEVFKRACQYNDAFEIHERLTSIYIQSGKHTRADELFQVLIKKFSQYPNAWYNYAHFLHYTMSSPDRAWALLPRAIQSLPSHNHLALTIKFAALEFHSPHGSPERGRTTFEGVLSTFPKRLDLWNQLLDLEIQQGDEGIVRALFERVAKSKDLKPKGAKAWFKRWSEWEAKHGDAKSQEKVRAKAVEWVRATGRLEV
jgi:rRNA biogenesis protein RRP5